MRGVSISGKTNSGTAVLSVAAPSNIKIGGVTLTGRGLAGRFVGTVLVDGDLTVTGAKSAVVPGANGKHKILYCVESPEAWFEDFGEAKLNKGSVNISIPRDFAVREANGGASSIRFSFRIVAKRKDLRAPRLHEVEVPAIPTAPKPQNHRGQSWRRRN